jgi:hypothetical protein
VRGVAALLIALVVAPSAAVAHDHRPPSAALVSADRMQERRPYSSTWGYAHGKLCYGQTRDGSPSFGESLWWTPGDGLTLRFYAHTRPRDVRVVAYRAVDLAGRPVGDAEAIPYELKKRRAGGRIVWDAVLAPPVTPDLYVEALAAWSDRDGCGGQEAAWTFHASLLPL